MAEQDYVFNKSVDCVGLACPMPVVRAKKAIAELQSGEVLELLATDAGSIKDVPSWAGRVGHEYLGSVTEGKVYKHYIRKSRGVDA